MKETSKPVTTSFRLAAILGIFAVLLVFFDILFMLFARSEGNTVKLLKEQLVTLEQEEKIVNSANDIYKQYQDEVDMVSAVFPSEETIALFIQTLEETIRSNSDEYTLRFTAVTPVKESDRLYLPVVITAKTDMARLTSFLLKLEKLPYMTRVLSIDGKGDASFTGGSDVQIVLKVYVQNPFST